MLIDPAIAIVLGGAAVGFLLAVFGGGGSVLAAPVLLYLGGVTDAHVAVGTASAAVAANARACRCRPVRQKTDRGRRS